MIRNHSGEVYWYFCRRISNVATPFLAEILVAREVVCLILAKQLDCIILKCDVKSSLRSLSSLVLYMSDVVQMSGHIDYS